MKNYLKSNYKNIVIFLIPMTIFLLLFFAYYPGIIPYDGNYQWAQVQSGLINNDHPFLSTYFMFLLSKIWNNPSVVMLFQMFVFSFFWMIFCKKTRNEGNFKKQIIYTAFICLIPIISLYSFTIWKDVLYSYYMLMLAFITYDIGRRKFVVKISDLIYIGVLLFLIFSYRFNGMVVALLYIFTFSIILFKNNRKSFKKNLITVIVFVLLLGCLSIPKKVYLERDAALKPKNTEEVKIDTVNYYITWIFGNFLQEDVITPNDKNFLNNIIELEHWKESYNGYLVNSTYVPDEVDESFIADHTQEYRNMFIKYIFTYPYLLIDHYTESDSLLFSLNSMNDGYVYVFSFSNWEYLNFDGLIQSKIPVLEKMYTKALNLSFTSLFRIFYQPALFLYLSILFVIYLTKKYKIKNLYLILLPMVLNTVSLMPINLAQDLRYVYINYLTAAIIGLIYFSLDKGVCIMDEKKDVNLKKKNLKILMIIPAYNEENAILNTVSKIRKYNEDNNTHYDILVINDGSTDKTSDICRQNKIKVIDLIHNLGIGGSVQTGYKYAYDEDYDIAIQYDGDGQHDVNYVKNITKPIIEGDANFVIGSRFIKKNDNNFNSTFSRRVGIKLISFFMKLVSKKKIYDTTSGFRAADRSIIGEFAKSYPSEYPEPITTVELIKKGYKIEEVPVKMNERDGGVSSIRSWKSVYYMVNVILSILVVGSRRYK